MTTKYDNRKEVPNEAQLIMQKYAPKDKSSEKVKLNEVEYKLGNRTYIIKKWKHLDTLERLPEFMDIWYGQVLANQTEMDARDELAAIDDIGGSGIYALQFLSGLRNINFSNYVKQHLDSVYLKGEDSPIDLEEDVDSPMDIWSLFIKVSSVNFLMQLSQTICSTPTMIYLMESQEMTSTGE